MASFAELGAAERNAVFMGMERKLNSGAYKFGLKEASASGGLMKKGEINSSDVYPPSRQESSVTVALESADKRRAVYDQTPPPQTTQQEIQNSRSTSGVPEGLRRPRKARGDTTDPDDVSKVVMTDGSRSSLQPGFLIKRKAQISGSNLQMKQGGG